MLTDGTNALCQVAQMQDEKGAPMPSAPHPKQRLTVTLTPLTDSDLSLTVGLVLRKRDE
jgi:hypothetical protein